MKSVFNFLFIFVVIAVSFVEAGGDYRCTLPLENTREMGKYYCLANMPRYGYQASTDECVRFIYGGCGGNENNFYNKALCEKACRGGY